MKMLMRIDPPTMGGSLVMTMALISPSRREVSPAESLSRSPRLLLPKFRLEMAALCPESFLLIFFLGQNPPYSRRWISGLARGPQAWRRALGRRAPPGLWPSGGSSSVVSSPNIFYIFQYNSSKSFRIFGVVQNMYLRFAPF